MQIPEWLLSMIYRCLRKKPEERFSNGVELHNYVFVNSVGSSRSQFDTTTTDAWQAQAEKLLKEKQQLQQQLAAREAEIQRLTAQPVITGPERYPGQDDYPVNPKKSSAWIVAFILTLLVASGLAYALIQSDKKEPEKEQIANDVPKELVPIGEYRVKAARANFHNEANDATRRSAFIPKDELLTAYEQKDGFIYTEFTNGKGQVSKGWLKLSDLMTKEEWEQLKSTQPVKPTDAQIREQLNTAAGYLSNNQVPEALTIYNFLVPFEVPEALYGAANLALQGKNGALSCDDANAWLKKAADAGNLSAKRTLGILYLFAENEAVLSINGYTRCGFEKDFARGKTYLSQAAAGGDTTAQELLSGLNVNE